MNKKTKFSVGIGLSIFLLFGLFMSSSPAKTASAQYAVPECTAATLNGYIETTRETQVWFEWGVGSSITYSTPKKTVSSNQTFSQRITGLEEDTLYSYRAMSSRSTGNIISFRTKDCTEEPPQGKAPSVTLTADDTSIAYGDSTILRWETDNNPTSCVASLAWSGSKDTDGGSQSTGSLTSDKTYKITCSNQYGSDSDTVTVSVGDKPNDPPEDDICRNRDAINYGGRLPCRFEQNDPAPTVNLTANPTHVTRGGSSVLSWTSQNASSCSASGGTGNWGGTVQRSGSQTIGNITQNTTFVITCRNNEGETATDSATVTVEDNEQPGGRPTVEIDADDTSIDEGDDTTVRWTSQNADYCTASGGRNGWSGSRSRSGSFDTGDLHSDTTYDIRCYNEYGSDEDSVTVRVDEDNNNDNNDDEPTVNIYASPSHVNYGGSTTITWNSHDADRCSASGGTSGWSGSRSRSGSFYVPALYGATTFRINCYNDEGSASDSTTVTVGNIVTQSTQPTVLLYADNTSVTSGGATFIRWSTLNATSCYASGGSAGWAGQRSIGPGSFYTGSLNSSRTYTLTCTNESGGSDTDSVTVSVRRPSTPVPPRPVASSLVVLTSAIEKNQPIIPTLDITNPKPGDQINYTVTYQNIGTGSISNLTLRLDLPYEVEYMSSSPNNPMISGNTLIFNLGTLRANGQGTVNVRVRVRQDAPIGAFLNFPAVLSYTDPAGYPQSVTANVSAQVWSEETQTYVEEVPEQTNMLGASIFGAGFWPTSLFGWLLFLILVLILVLLVRSLYGGTTPFQKRVTTVEHHH